jgi:predicted acyl esterase
MSTTTRLTACGLLATLTVLGRSDSAQTPAFTYQHAMIPVRDGVKLETVIMAPSNAPSPLPILFRRTPYGVPKNADGMSSASLADFVNDGYIFVVQNLRGRFGS